MRNPLKSLVTPGDRTSSEGGESTAPPPEGGTERRRYDHEQVTPSTVWVVDHALGLRPIVHVRDTANREVMCEVTHTSDSRVEITHGIPVAGAATFLS